MSTKFKGELKETDKTRADARQLAKMLSKHNEGAALAKTFPKEKHDSPVCFPPGLCAGPKALALALEDGALLSGITERWFHSGKGRTEGKVEHLRSDREAPITKSFGHGESVPPCGSCNIILPLMLCTKGKEGETKCQHQKKQ